MEKLIRKGGSAFYQSPPPPSVATSLSFPHYSSCRTVDQYMRWICDSAGKRSADDVSEAYGAEESGFQCLYKGICTFMASSDEELKILGGPLYPFIKRLIR